MQPRFFRVLSVSARDGVLFVFICGFNFLAQSENPFRADTTRPYSRISVRVHLSLSLVPPRVGFGRTVTSNKQPTTRPQNKIQPLYTVDFTKNDVR